MGALVALTVVAGPAAAERRAWTRQAPGPLAGLADRFEVKPTRPLLHQVEHAHSTALEKQIGKAFRDLPRGWLDISPIWTSEGEVFWGDRKDSGVFQLRLDRGWRFVQKGALVEDSVLVRAWHRHYRDRRMPRNGFSQRVQDQLRASGYPTHSSFYAFYRIAGFYMDDSSHSGWRRSYVFLHDQAATVRLIKRSRPKLTLAERLRAHDRALRRQERGGATRRHGRVH